MPMNTNTNTNTNTNEALWQTRVRSACHVLFLLLVTTNAWGLQMKSMGRRRPTSRMFSALSTSGTQHHHHHEGYETSLTEMESDILYGTTPKMCDLDQLAGWVRRDRLDLSPKYQRGYVWKEDRASRLVVTALCNRIVPGVVLHEVSKGTYDVVDGKQRLTTLLSFYLAGEDPKVFQKLCAQHERFHKRSKGLFTTLRKLDENYEDLEGLTYDDLSTERQFALQSFTIPCTVIPLGTPKTEVFSCYEDINSGGEDLTAQQLRRAVFYGDYIELLDKLASNPDFQCIRDPKRFRRTDDDSSALCPKESDRELILRALAWARNYAKFKRPLKTFLNAELQHYESLAKGDPTTLTQKELERRGDEFVFVMKIWRNVFSEEDGAFRAWTRRNGKWMWSPTITVGLWDVLYSVLVELRHSFPTEPIYIQNKDALKRAIQDLFESGKLEVSTTATITKFLARRDTIRSALLAVLQDERRASLSNRRSFVQKDALKSRLYKTQEGLCTICGTSIDQRRLGDGTYVHLDHIEPFSKGGKSVQENAALTHAACNMSKGAKTLSEHNE